MGFHSLNARDGTYALEWAKLLGAESRYQNFRAIQSLWGQSYIWTWLDQNEEMVKIPSEFREDQNLK